MSLYTMPAIVARPETAGMEQLEIVATTDHELLARINDIPAAEARNRIENGHVAFVALYDRQPAAFGWVATGKGRIGELDHAFELPPGHAYLWNFRTLPAYRGKGIYPALLQFIVRSTAIDCHRFWIIHAPENRASQRGIVKAGFTYVGQLHIGQSRRLEFRHVEEYYGRLAVQVLQLPAAVPTDVSCWSCSSPYVKKREHNCCCSAAAQVCVHNGVYHPHF